MNKQLLLAAVLIAPIYVYAKDCSYSKHYSFSVDAASLVSLRLARCRRGQTYSHGKLCQQ